MKIRVEQEKLCLLVTIGVRTDGKKELIALTDGCCSRKAGFGCHSAKKTVSCPPCRWMSKR